MAGQKNEIWEWVKALGAALVIAFIIRTFLFAPIEVEGSSMMPTLENHDRMIVTKIEEPERFDIVVFHATKESDYIKRVIGLPGDQVEYKSDNLFVNGKQYEEPFLNEYKNEHRRVQLDGPYTEDFSITVPEGSIFVLGDNRRNSTDSRHIGAIPLDKVVGTTKVIYWPFSEIRILGK